MKFVDMKFTKEELKKRDKDNKVTEVPSMGEREIFPYGLELRLDEDAIKKLGINVKSFAAGDVVQIGGIAKVQEIRDVDRISGSRQSMELQVTSIGVEKKTKDKQAQYQDGQNAGPGE